VKTMSDVHKTGAEAQAESALSSQGKERKDTTTDSGKGSALIVHNFSRGLRGLRVMWMCEEMGLPYKVSFVSYPPSADFKSLNPLGRVPFLQDAGNVGMHESIAIMLYLAGKYGPTSLLPSPHEASYPQVLQMLVFGEATLGASMNTLLAAKFSAPAESKQNWSATTTQSRLKTDVDYLAKVIGDGPFLGGSNITVADISVGCALGLWAGALGQPLPDNLAAYLDRLKKRSAYQQAALKNEAKP